MQDAQDVKIISRNGVDYRVRRNPDGTFTNLGPVSQAQGQADPTFQYQAPQAEADVVRTQTQTAGQGLTNQYDAATLPARTRQAEADADAAEAAARDAQLTPGQRKADEAFAERYAKWTADGGLVGYNQKLAALEGIVQTLKDNDTITGPVIGRMPRFVQEMVDPRGPDLREQLERIVQDSLKQVLDSQFAQKEAQQVLQRSFNPNLEESFNVNRVNTMIDDLKQRGMMMDSMAQHWQANGTISSWQAPRFNPEDPETKLSDDGTKDTIDRKRQVAAAQMGVMINQGKSFDEIADYASGAGIDVQDETFTKTLREAIDFSKTREYHQWQQQHPGEPYPFNPDFYTYNREMTGLEKGLYGAATGEVLGVNPGAAVISAGNAVSGNNLDNLVGLAGGDAQSVRTNMSMLRAAAPGSSFVGDVVGEGVFQTTAGRIPGMQWVRGKKFGNLADDAGYGLWASTGDENNGVAGNVAANTFGGIAGRRMFGAAGTLAKGLDSPSPSLRYLYDEGVTPTIGMIGRGTDTRLGRAVANVEDVASGTPGLSSFTAPAQRRAFQQFDSAAFRQAGASGDNIGREGLEELGRVRDDAYSFVEPLRLPYDANFAGRQAMIRNDAATMPDFGPGVAGNLDVLDSAARNGEFRGTDWQSGLRAARADRSSLAGQPFSDRPVAALRETEDNLIDLANRHGPAGTQDALGRANTIHRDYSTLTNAADNGPYAKRGEIIGPDRLDTAARQTGRNFGGRAASTQGNRPFYDLTQAGMDALPSRLPDSGTAGRAAALGLGATAIGGTDYDSEGGLGYDSDRALTVGAIAAIPALAYSKRGQKLIADTLLGKRSPFTSGLINTIESTPVIKTIASRRGGGMFGRGVSRDFFLYPELEQ